MAFALFAIYVMRSRRQQQVDGAHLLSVLGVRVCVCACNCALGLGG